MAATVVSQPKTKAKFAPSPVPIPEQVLTYCPLAESLQRELGPQYFLKRGNEAFISGAIPLPLLININGTLSRNAADVLLANCQAAEKVGEFHENAFILMNECGMTQVGGDNEYEHHRFSFATAVGLNFPPAQSLLCRTRRQVDVGGALCRQRRRHRNSAPRPPPRQRVLALSAI